MSLVMPHVGVQCCQARVSVLEAILWRLGQCSLIALGRRAIGYSSQRFRPYNPFFRGLANTLAAVVPILPAPGVPPEKCVADPEEWARVKADPLHFG